MCMSKQADFIPKFQWCSAEVARGTKCCKIQVLHISSVAELQVEAEVGAVAQAYMCLLQCWSNVLLQGRGDTGVWQG